MNSNTNTWNTISWIIGVLFLIIGVLNMVLIHIVPGLIYVLISLVYIPPVEVNIKKNLGFSIPTTVKIILAVLIMWFTLGVGDLMELFESKIL